MGFSATGAQVWPVPPDWSDGVEETLSWATDILLASATARTQHRATRVGPRRSFTFRVAARGQERRVADMLVNGHSGCWELPIWPDVHWLTAPLAIGSTQIPCITNGRDLVSGGRALLYAAVNQWEMVTIDTVEADQITLATPTVGSYGPGHRLYPLRRARLQDGAEERLRSSDAGRRTLSFDIAEKCDWPTLTMPTYRGHPVLDRRPDESEDPTTSVNRLVQTVDYGVGLPMVHDLPAVALRTQKTHWKLFGRADHSWYRSLVYTLDGRRVPLWLPSWTDDLRPVATVAGGSVSMPVEWTGYTLFGKAKPNRQDVRIELTDGTALYRRIVNAVEAGATETLTLDAALDETGISPERIRQVSFMALSMLASDQVEIEHVTDGDGVATSTLGWQVVVPDV